MNGMKSPMRPGKLAISNNTKAVLLNIVLQVASSRVVPVVSDWVNCMEPSAVELEGDKGLLSAPQTARLRQSPAMILSVPCHPKMSSSALTRGARTKVPTPEPHVAIP